MLTKRRRGHPSRAHASLQSGDGAMPPERIQNSLGRLCLRVQNGIPFRPERKNVPSIFSQPIPWLWPTGPTPCNVGGFGTPFSNQKGTIFRTAKPVPNSALPATNIASIGGAGVRHGEHGWGRFFRSGRTRVRWCCTAIVMCAVWSMDAGKSYRWARHARSKKQAKTTCRGLASP